jgi:acyl-CoA thioesterase I
MRALIAMSLVIAACGPAAAPPPTPTLTTPPSSRPPSSPAPTRTPAASATQLPSGTPIVRPSGAIHYVAIGASDTVGVGSLDPATGSWPSRLAALLPPGSTYRNLGVSGSLTAQAQREQLPAAIREQPTIVTVWLAVNDINAGVPPKDHAAALDAIVGALVQGTGARVFVGTIPDLRAVPAYASMDPLVVLATVQTFNAGIVSLGAKYPGRVRIVDLNSGSAELMSSVTVSADGFHPSDAGYELIAQRFATAMRSGGIPLR